MAGDFGRRDLPGETFRAERAMWINPAPAIVATVDEESFLHQSTVMRDIVMIDLHIMKVTEDVVIRWDRFIHLYSFDENTGHTNEHAVKY